jgi:Putative zinc-finger
MDADDRARDHLDSGDVAGYLDGAVLLPDRSRVERHLADCVACRDELRAVARLLHTQPRRGGRVVRVGVAVAAVAAALLLFARAPAGDRPVVPTTREPVVAGSVAPVVVAPLGIVRGPRVFTWSAVPRADLYRLTLFDDAGRAIWETQQADTIATMPRAIRLRRGASYFWKVEAQTGWNRWVSSDLVRFSIDSGGR